MYSVSRNTYREAVEEHEIGRKGVYDAFYTAQVSKDHNFVTFAVVECTKAPYRDAKPQTVYKVLQSHLPERLQQELCKRKL